MPQDDSGVIRDYISSGGGGDIFVLSLGSLGSEHFQISELPLHDYW